MVALICQIAVLTVTTYYWVGYDEFVCLVFRPSSLSAHILAIEVLRTANMPHGKELHLTGSQPLTLPKPQTWPQYCVVRWTISCTYSRVQNNAVLETNSSNRILCLKSRIRLGWLDIQFCSRNEIIYRLCHTFIFRCAIVTNYTLEMKGKSIDRNGTQLR